MKILRTDSENKGFKSLVRHLDSELEVIDGDAHSFYDQYNKIDLIKNVVVIYSSEKPIGCGAFKLFKDQTVEVKRMYTLPENRGQGIASKVLQELEIWAKDLGYTDIVLETGKTMESAIGLYQSKGYHVIDNYPPYVGVDNSICFSKRL
ncbi:GNAT family N-acetyltransferase [bacterium SCSIO 12643]|nr:GNAT family N-acetyltransferase [bacterium SCSIO 12643]